MSTLQGEARLVPVEWKTEKREQHFLGSVEVWCAKKPKVETGDWRGRKKKEAKGANEASSSYEV